MKLICILTVLLLPGIVLGVDNSYINSASGKWETAGNWSAGAPAISNGNNFITNALSKTVTIDATTTNSPGTLTISNLFLFSNTVGPTNTLALVNAGLAVPLHIIATLTVAGGGALTVSNSALVVDGPSAAGLTIDGNVSFLDGSLVATNSPTAGNLILGYNVGGRGQMTINGGSLSVFDCILGKFNNTQGTLTIAGGTNIISTLTIAGAAGTTGTVWTTGGVLTGNTSVRIGSLGVGRMIFSNGAANISTLWLDGPSSTLTMAGGAIDASSTFQVALSTGTTGSVWLTGGQISVTNAATTIGTGNGQMIISNGTFLARDVNVAATFGVGTLTVAGGTAALSSNLTVAGTAIGRTGTVWITGGKLVATNASTIIGVQGFGRLTVSNGTWLAKDVILGSAVFGQGTLTIVGGTNAMTGPLTVGSNFLGASTGTVWVTGGQLVITNTPATVGAGSGFIVDGSVMLTNGSSLNVSNVNTIIGNVGAGTLTFAGGALNVSNLFIGNITNSLGTCRLNDGTISVAGSLDIGLFTDANGLLTMSAGTVVLNIAPASRLRIGNAGKGQLIIAGGTVVASQGEIGIVGLSSGTLTVAGGTNLMYSSYSVGENSFSTGTVWLTSGALILTNNLRTAFVNLGGNGLGRMAVSNGLFVADRVQVGTGGGSAFDELDLFGGATIINTNLIIGTTSCAFPGTVIIAGGSFYVTNAQHNATVNIRSGTLELHAGTLVIDRLVITNTCGRFIKNGGSVTITSTNLDSTLDADGDGIPNAFDLDPFNPADAGQDPDGDGFTNLQEFQAGTNPTNSASFLGITGIARETNDIRVTWMTGPGKTNALQATAGDGSGNFVTNNFTDLFTVTNTIGSVTNYLDIGGATNFPSRYYRVRLSP